MAEDFNKVVENVHSMADDMAKSQKSAEGIHTSFLKLGLALEGVRVVNSVFEQIVTKSAVWQRLTTAISRENLNIAALTERRDKSEKSYLSYIQKNESIGRLQSEGYKQGMALRAREFNLSEKQLTLAKELHRFGMARFVTLTATVSAARDLWSNQRQFNQNLIEANSTYAHRNELLKNTLMLQTQSGISFDKVTNAARALVSYGMDTESSFEANLKIVSQMEQGLGVSVSESARLASVVERQVKGSFEGVARTIAQIVEDTALAGDEAARLSLNISTALGRLRPGLGAAGLPDVLRLVGRYEGALKEIGGSSGALTQLLTQMTTPEGIVGAGALGANPEFLATADGVQTVITRFGQYGQMLVGQSQGWERQMRLQALAQQFNISSDQANQLMLAIKRANEQQMGTISLQDRWKQQLNATNSGISRLTTSLWGLLQTGLLPVVNLVGMLANKLADLVEVILQSKTTVFLLGTGLAAAGLAAALSLQGVVRGLWAVVMGSQTATAALGRYAAAQAARGGVGAGGFIGPMQPVSLMRTVIPMAASLAVIAAAVGIVAYFAHKEWMEIKRLREEQAQAQKIIFSKNEALEANRKAKLYAAARFGNAGDVEALYQKLAGDATQKFQGIDDPTQRRAATKEWLDRMMAESKLDIAKGVTTAGMWTPLTERTPAQKKHEDEILAVTQQMYKVNVDQRILAEKDMRAKLEQQQEMEINEAQNRGALWLQGRYNPFGWVSDQMYKLTQ